MTFAPDHHILVDLGPATEGFAGIPQESRLILDALWRTPGIAPTGLLYGSDWPTLYHRFPGPAVSPDERLENHAVYFSTLADGLPPDSWLMRRPNALARLLRRRLGTKVQLDMIDNDVHGESVWRLFLDKSLGHHGLELARKCPLALANLSRHALKLRTLSHVPPFALPTAEYDFVIMHEAAPLHVAPNTVKLFRHHDLIPGAHPELVGSSTQVRQMLHGIRRCQDDSVFVCNSEPTKAELLRVFPKLRPRTVAIADVLGDQLFRDPLPRMLPSIVVGRWASDLKMPRLPKTLPPYLLMVCTIEPRKNHLALIRAYEQILARHETPLKLMFVGGAGWKNGDIRRAMAPLIKAKRLYCLERVPPEELRVLYTHADAVVFPSFCEGFGYSPLEAMQCGSPVIASDIATHRWVYGDAALYADPFDTESLRGAIERLALSGDMMLRRQLVAAGFERVRLYTADVIGRQWKSLCDEIRRQGGVAAPVDLTNWSPTAPPQLQSRVA